MTNISVLTPREIKRIMSRKQTIYLSYLIADKYISKYDDEAVKLLHNYYRLQKSSWSQSSNNGTHIFLVEYKFDDHIVSVHSKINTSIFICHGIFDLKRIDDYTRSKFLAGLFICEYEKRLDEMMSKFKLEAPQHLEDYEFPF